MDEIKKIPPVTRFIVLGTVAVTVPCLLKIVDLYQVVYLDYRVIGNLEIWRPITAFLYGGSGIACVFDLFMMHNYSVFLEQNMGTPAYAWRLLLHALVIMVLNYPLRSLLFGRPLLLSIMTSWSLLNPAAITRLFGMVNVQAQYLPFAMLALEFVQVGMGPVVSSATGLITAYLLSYLDGLDPTTLAPPAFFLNFVNKVSRSRATAPGVATANVRNFFRPQTGQRLGAAPRTRYD